MKSKRGVIVGAVALVVACLSGAASLLAGVDAKLPAVPGTPTPVSLLLAKQGRILDCSDQDDDDDDDRDEAKAGKPDTDDVELQCGDQDDDDGEIEDDDAPGKHHEREKSEHHREAPHAAKPTKAGK